MRVPFEVILSIELLIMIIRGMSPPLLPSSYATVINRNDNQRHLIGYTLIEKSSRLSYIKVKNVYKRTLSYYRYTKVKKENTFIAFVKLIIAYKTHKLHSRYLTRF